MVHIPIKVQIVWNIRAQPYCLVLKKKCLDFDSKTFFTALNDGHGLLDYSEENLEKMHKVARRLREKKCRLTGPKENLTDLLNRYVSYFNFQFICQLVHHLNCIITRHRHPHPHHHQNNYHNIILTA